MKILMIQRQGNALSLRQKRQSTNKHATINNTKNNKYENTFSHGVHLSTKIRNEKTNQSFFSGNTLD